MHPGKCSPLVASPGRELGQPGHKSQDSARPEGGRREAVTSGSCGFRVEQKREYAGRGRASALPTLVTEAATRVRVYL